MQKIYITKFYLNNSKDSFDYGAAILDKAVHECQLQDLDLLVIATGLNTNHPYYEGFFAEHYGIKAKILNVVDQGVLVSIHALQIIMHYLENEEYSHAMLLVLENDNVREKHNPTVIAIRFDKRDMLDIGLPRLIAAGLFPDIKLHANSSQTIYVNSTSCIRPLLYLDSENVSMIKSGIHTMIINDSSSGRKGYLLWESS